MKKAVHIVVQDGLVRAVYAENTEVDAIIYDLDTDNNEEYDNLISTLTTLRQSDNVNKVY
jgi:uncharacterized Rossmann fold enzyme